jgi:hypothetical protein
MAKRAAVDPLERDDGYLEKKRKIDTVHDAVDVLKKYCGRDNEKELVQIVDEMPQQVLDYLQAVAQKKENVAAPPPKEKESKFTSDAVSPYNNLGLMLTLFCLLLLLMSQLRL